MRAEGLPARTFPAVSSNIALILGTMPKVDIDGCLLGSSENAKDWATESAKLCSSMCRNFTDPGTDKTALVNFTTWASVDPPSVENGINFANVCYAVRCGGRSADLFLCARTPKSPSNNSYTRVLSRLDYRNPVDSVNRLRRFLRTTLSGTDGLELLLAMYSLVAAGIRLPEVMLIFAGEGGEGESLLLSTPRCMGFRTWRRVLVDASSRGRV